MQKDKKILIYGLGALGAILLLSGGSSGYLDILAKFIPAWESFSPTPYWDVSRYSWGYGTQAPGPTGTITREQAFKDMIAHLQADKTYLGNYITRNLSPNQWAALLSFSYNEGPGRADNLATNINAGDWTALESQWKSYIYAGGVQNSNLKARRNAEWALFLS